MAHLKILKFFLKKKMKCDLVGGMFQRRLFNLTNHIHAILWCYKPQMFHLFYETITYNGVFHMLVVEQILDVLLFDRLWFLAIHVATSIGCKSILECSYWGQGVDCKLVRTCKLLKFNERWLKHFWFKGKSYDYWSHIGMKGVKIYMHMWLLWFSYLWIIVSFLIFAFVEMIGRPKNTC